MESLVYNKESKFKRMFRLATLNGCLFRPRKETVTVSVGSDIKSNYYRARRVLNFDENSMKGFVVEKSLKEMFRLLRRLHKILRLIDRKFKKTVKHYRNDYEKYITSDFWEKLQKEKEREL